MPLLLTHVAATWFLAGLSWVVLVVVYPAFAHTGRGRGWQAAHGDHSRRMTAVVVLPWLLHGATLALLLLVRPAGVPLWLLALAAVAGAATVLLTVRPVLPLHARLGERYDADVLHRLVVAHGWRTAAWSVSAGCALAMVALAT